MNIGLGIGFGLSSVLLSSLPNVYIEAVALIDMENLQHKRLRGVNQEEFNFLVIKRMAKPYMTDYKAREELEREYVVV